MGGGGDTTNVTNTGLGDAQYTTLTGNQANLGTSIDTLNTTATTGLSDVNTSLGGLRTGMTDVGTKVDDVGSNVFDVKNAVGTKLMPAPDSGVIPRSTGLYGELEDQTNYMRDQFGNIIATQGNINTSVTNNAGALTGLQSDVTGGFDDQATRFDAVDTSVGNVQGAVDQGFVDQTQGFADAQTDRTTNAGANAQGFVDADAAMTQGFGDAATQLTATQANVLGGQDTLQGELDVMSDDNTTYANQALENQAALQTGQEGFQTSFDTYTERYGEDTTLANQTRADMQLANANASNKIRAEQAAIANASSQQLGNVAQGVDSQFNALEGTVEGGFMASDANTREGLQGVEQAGARSTANAATDLQNSLASGLDNLDAGQITAARDLAKIASSQTDLDIGMRQEFNQLGSAFDDTGSLISSSIDEQGNTINRRMDAQGNLILNRFSVTGEALGNRVINIRNSLDTLNNLQQRQGANVSMGNLTPASSSAVPSSGFASPFATTG